jgi:pimeloyl-ACP methyl ester carboxylesterase
MQVQTLPQLQLRLAGGTGSAPTQQQPPAPPRPPEDDPLSADQFSFDFPSVHAQQPTDEIYEMPSERAPKLNRPVLLVHGFNGHAENWSQMKTWFVRDGQNIDGGVVNGKTLPDANANVFSMEFSRPFNPVSNNASELRQAIDKICAATGAEEIDVVAHSMGGLDARLYLDQGNEKINKLMMVATPNHGSVLADIELTFRELGLPIKPPTDDPLVRQALTDLSEVRGDNNPLLKQLNKNWDRQKQRADMCIITGNGFPTLSSRFTMTIKGDSVVSRASAEMPGIPSKRIWTASHSGVKEHPKTLQWTAAFLTDRAMPMDDPDPVDTPADREIVPEQINADVENLHYVIRGGEKKAS